MTSEVFKVFILASTIGNRVNLSCAYVMKNKIIYPCKIPCEMYIGSLLQKELLKPFF